MVKAAKSPILCIECGLCLHCCEDTEHQAIYKTKSAEGKRTYADIDDECVICNLCALLFPVPECITMAEHDTVLPYRNWTEHPNNPTRVEES